MERAVKNCVDDKFSESNLNTLLWRIGFGFSDTSNIFFFNCSKDELLCKKQQLILEYNNLGIDKTHIKRQFNIDDNELNNIIENSIKEKDKDNLIKEIDLLHKKELFLDKKMDFIDEKIKLLDEKLNIIDDKLKNNEIKTLFLHNHKKRKLNI